MPPCANQENTEEMVHISELLHLIQSMCHFYDLLCQLYFFVIFIWDSSPSSALSPPEVNSTLFRICISFPLNAPLLPVA